MRVISPGKAWSLTARSLHLQQCWLTINVILGFFLHSHKTNFRADSRFAPSQWEAALLCNNVSHWLSASLESALNLTASGGDITGNVQNELEKYTFKNNATSLGGNVLNPDKFQRYLNQITKNFYQENAYKDVVCKIISHFVLASVS